MTESVKEKDNSNFEYIAERVLSSKADVRIKKLQSPLHVRNNSRLNASAKNNTQIQS